MKKQFLPFSSLDFNLSDIAYKPLTQIEKIFKDLIWDPAVAAWNASLKIAFPFLRLPVLGQIQNLILKTVADWVFSSFVLLVDVVAIRLVNSEHQREYDNASIKLMGAADKFGENSPEFKKAREDAKAALSKFARFGG